MLHLTDPPQPERPGWMPTPRMLLGLVLAATFAAYLGTLRYEFVGDDRYQIVGNPHVQSWHFVGRYFTEHVWSHAELKAPDYYYRPFFLLWLRINHLLFGLDPWGWHLTTVVVHLVVTLLVYSLVRKILKDEWSAGVAALVFGLHPIHVESVAWISGVTDPLVAVFALASFLCYLELRERTKQRRAWSVTSLVLYGFALLSKETAVVLPFLILAYEWIFMDRAGEVYGWRSFQRRIRAVVVCVVPYLGLTGLYLAVREIVLKGIAPVSQTLPLSTLLFTIPTALWFYIKHLIWPAGLNALYTASYVREPQFNNFVLPALAVAVAALGLGWCSRRSSGIALAAMWLVLPIIPVLDLRLLPKADFLHDRYLYLSSVGFALIAGAVWQELPTRWSKLFGRPAARIVPVLALAGVLAAGIMSESGYWKNDLLLAEREISESPGSLDVKNSLGIALAERDRLDEAVKLWQQILARGPTFFPALYNLGYFSYRAGRFEEAERYLQRALEVDPTDSSALVCLGLTRLKMGQLGDAEAALRRAIALRPQRFGSHFVLGFVLRAKGDLPAALEEFQRELRNYPEHSLAREQVAQIEMTLRLNSRSKGSFSNAPALPEGAAPR